MGSIFKICTLLILTFQVSLQLSAQKKTQQIKIVRADEGTSHPTLSNTHVLTGNVLFEHDSTLMYCDSAYFYLDSNAFEAFSNVQVLKGDSIKLTGDTLYYRGTQRTADMFGNVRYTDRTLLMVTPSLHYDLKEETGSYSQSATITNLEDKNTLYSKKGLYYSKTQTMHFKDSVRLFNDEYEMTCDTLEYQSNTKTATFLGPTEITSKENTIHCTRGIYNTETEISSLWAKPIIVTQEQTLSGDSIYYDRNTGIGKVYGDVSMIDTTNKVNLYGDFGYHNELKDTTAITGSALMIQKNEKDTLFLKAEFLTIKTDSTQEQKKIKAYRNVQIYKSDFQAMCDSLSYSDVDSLMKFFIDPVLWSGESQITGKYIEAQTGKETIQRLDVLKDAFIISEIDSLKYNQIKGRDVTALFEDGKISIVDVLGNGQTLYYILNDDSLYLEANQAKCATLKITFENEEISYIKFLDAPNAKYNAIEKLTSAEAKFEGFQWLGTLRPERKQFLKENLETQTEEKDN